MTTTTSSSNREQPADSTWHAARLIPTSGINGADEQERRATSALLAVMSAVREFGRGLIRPLGAPAGNVETFIEVPFQHGDRRIFPDGLVRVSRGQKQWTALLEVKTGSNVLRADQLEPYLDVAKEHGFDALITISNEIPPIPGTHPTTVDKRKLKKVALHHWSWSQVLTEAILHKEHRGVSDPDQAWILGELIRYLEHPRSGALEFDDMGSSWVPVRNSVTSGTLRATDPNVAEVVQRFDALVRYVGLQLGRRLGTEVTLCLTRKELAEPSTRASGLAKHLEDSGVMAGAIRIPDAVGPLNLTVDLRSNQVRCHIDIDAPREGRARTRVNWLVRQLRRAPDDLRIEASVLHGRGPGTTGLLGAVRQSADLLIQDPTKDLKNFRIIRATPLGTKRGATRGSFVASVTEAVDEFYENVVQYLKAWSATPPKYREDLPAEVIPQDIRPALVSTAMSSQDGAEDVPNESSNESQSCERQAAPPVDLQRDLSPELLG